MHSNPVRHSISPVMHNAALEAMAAADSRFSDWSYYRFEIEPDAFPEALPHFHRRSFMGLNLTVPHKVQALDLIQGLSPDADRMGAVNTLVWNEHGYDGFNTDGYGLQKGLEADLGVTLKGANVLLLGSGGAARAAAVQALLAGCARLWIGNRSQDRLQSLLAVLEGMEGADRVSPFRLEAPPGDLPPRGVLVNATSLGLRGDDPLPLDPSRLPPGWAVYDMIYNPPETPLLRAAATCGMRTANGLSMLVFQGVRALEIWSHTPVRARSMMTAACHALQLPPRYDADL